MNITTDEVLSSAFNKLLLHNRTTCQITYEYLCSKTTIEKLAKKYKLSIRSTYRRIQEGREFLREQLAQDSRVVEQSINEKFPHASDQPNRSKKQLQQH
jgi:hypothetical protein